MESKTLKTKYILIISSSFKNQAVWSSCLRLLSTDQKEPSSSPAGGHNVLHFLPQFSKSEYFYSIFAIETATLNASKNCF